MLCQITYWSTTHYIDCSGMWRLQRDKRESRDPAGSVANEEARPRSARKRPHVTEISKIHSLKYHEPSAHGIFLYTCLSKRTDNPQKSQLSILF